MGQLVNGKWQHGEVGTASKDGTFQRAESVCRNWIKANGSTQFLPEVGRYHLYVADACPWAHRTRLFRCLKNLEGAISLSTVDPYMGQNGWWFSGDSDTDPDPLYGADYLHEIYTRSDATYTGRVTVPVLWDKQRECIVSNESAEIIRMLNSEFVGTAGNSIDFYPKALQNEIEQLNTLIYECVNNGVYRCGFARTQEAYDNAVAGVFECLDQLEGRLGNQRFLCGNTLTEADWRLFVTLVRFDAVYVNLFRTNLRRIADYPALSGYLRDLYQWEGVAETVHMPNVKAHYFKSLTSINPFGIIAKGPANLDLGAPHDRTRWTAEITYF